jgi:hypothetical protein
MNITEIGNWTEIQGVLLDGNYPLVECVEQSGDGALFRTIAGNVTRNVRVRVPDTHQMLPLWNKLQRSPHPNLASVIAAGQATVNGGVLEYVVMEQWDDTLAAVLPERELTAAEASEMLESIVPGLSHLHGLGMVHGGIEPARIVSAGGKIKLEVPEPHVAAQGRFSTAADISALGATVAECLTRERSASTKPIPEPFGAIVRRCLNEEPAKRPSATEVLALLHGEYVEHPEPVTVPQEIEAPVRVVSKKPVLWAAAGLIGVTALVAGLVLHRPSPQPVATPAPPVTANPAARASAPTPAPPSERDVWRVIAYTFSQAKDAEKRVQRINEKWPEAHAQVFSIVPGKAPYLVSIGGRMSRTEAQRFRKRAVGHGLPAGSYSQNFNH